MLSYVEVSTDQVINYSSKVKISIYILWTAGKPAAPANRALIASSLNLLLSSPAAVGVKVDCPVENTSVVECLMLDMSIN